MARCYICGTCDPRDFEDSRNDFCDRCKDILDYWFNEALTDINTTSFALKGNKVSAKDFADALEVYGNTKWREEYERSKDRKKR
jgi:hypothetical protein